MFYEQIDIDYKYLTCVVANINLICLKGVH